MSAAYCVSFALHHKPEASRFVAAVMCAGKWKMAESAGFDRDDGPARVKAFTELRADVGALLGDFGAPRHLVRRYAGGAYEDLGKVLSGRGEYRQVYDWAGRRVPVQVVAPSKRE